MRKINKTIISIAIFVAATIVPLSISLETYADIGMPYTYSYEVVVVNPDGAETDNCRTNSRIANGTRVTVNYEKTGQDGKKLLYISDGEYEGCYINSSDIVYVEQTFDISSVPQANPIAQYILTEESYLYKGPNERYGRNDDNYHLPAGIVVTSSYHDDVWMYVEYDGHAGWIYHYNVFQNNPKTANVATDEWNRIIIPTRGTIELKDTPFEDGKVIGSINVEPLIEIPVSYYFNKGKFVAEVYINFGQYSGWYLKNSTDHSVAFRTNEYNDKGITVVNTSLTKDVDSEEGFYMVPANTEYVASYYVGNGYIAEKYYIKATVGSTVVEGWADYNDLATALNEGEKDRSYDNKKQLYDAVNGNPIGVIEAGVYRVFNYYPVNDKESNNYYYWYYIGKQNSDGVYEKLGWVKDVDDEEIQEIEKKKKNSILATIINEEPETYVYPITEENSQGNDELVKNMLLWSLVGASVLAAVIIVSLLIAKKRNDNNDKDGKNEVKSEETVENNGERTEEPKAEEPNTEEINEK